MELFSRIFQKEKSLEKRDEIYFLQNYRYKSNCRNQIGFSYLEKLPDLLESERHLREIA